MFILSVWAVCKHFIWRYWADSYSPSYANTFVPWRVCGFKYKILSAIGSVRESSLFKQGHILDLKKTDTERINTRRRGLPLHQHWLHLQRLAQNVTINFLVIPEYPWRPVKDFSPSEMHAVLISPHISVDVAGAVLQRATGSKWSNSVNSAGSLNTEKRRHAEV